MHLLYMTSHIHPPLSYYPILSLTLHSHESLSLHCLFHHYQSTCAYCGMSELDVCSPLVVGQCRREHDAHLELLKQAAEDAAATKGRYTPVVINKTIIMCNGYEDCIIRCHML